MTDSTKTSIGGWAETVINQTNEAARADSRKNMLLERLGQFFLSSLDESLTDDQRAGYLAGATAFAKEVKRVIQHDVTNTNVWGTVWCDDAIRGGVPFNIVQRELDLLSVREECNRDPVFRAKVQAASLKVLDES